MIYNSRYKLHCSQPVRFSLLLYELGATSAATYKTLNLFKTRKDIADISELVCKCLTAEWSSTYKTAVIKRCSSH